MKIDKSYRYRLILELRTYTNRDVVQLVDHVKEPRILLIYSRRKHGSHGEESREKSGEGEVQMWNLVIVT